MWWHYLVVIVPNKIDKRFINKSQLYINGGKNTEGIPQPTEEDVYVATELALKINAISAALFQIPNQQITFFGEFPLEVDLKDP